jgi:hypothetical protein
VPGCDHVSECGARGVHRGNQVDLDFLAPLVGIGIGHTFPIAVAGIFHEDVETPLLPREIIDGASQPCAVANIDLEHARCATGGLDLACHSFQTVETSGDQPDGRSTTRHLD